MMVVFEIHTFREGVWKIDSVFDDKELAVTEAQRMERAGRYSAIRVVEETFDEQTEKGNTRTVYRSTKVDRVNTESAERRKAPSTIAAPPKKAVPKKAQASFTRIMIMASLTLGAIVMAGIGIMYALHSLAG
jgi:hypothetical protein